MRNITSNEYNSLIDEITRLQEINSVLNNELNKKSKPLEFSQKLIIVTILVAVFVIVSTFILAYQGKEYPNQLVNDIITLTLTAEGGYFCQNGVRSIFTGDKTITNLKGNN